MLSLFLALMGGMALPTRPPSVKDLLTSLNLLEYEDLFVAEEITMDILVAMTEENLQSIGVRTFGQRFRIMRQAQEWTSVVHVSQWLKYFVFKLCS